MSYPPVSDSTYENAPDVHDVESSALVPGNVEDTNSNFIRSLNDRAFTFPEPEQQYLKRAWALSTEHIFSMSLLTLAYYVAAMGTIYATTAAMTFIAFIYLLLLQAMYPQAVQMILIVVGGPLVLLILGVLFFVMTMSLSAFPAGLMHALQQTARTGQAPKISDMWKPLRRSFPIFSLRLILVSVFTAIATSAVPALIFYAGMFMMIIGTSVHYGGLGAFLIIVGFMINTFGALSIVLATPFGMWALAVFVDRNMNGPGISAFSAVRASFIITRRAGFIWTILLTIGAMLLAQSGQALLHIGILFTMPLSAMWLVCIYDGLVGLSR